jgi:hypothetical protein
VQVFHGSIWATFNRAAPSFKDYLGGMALYLRDLLQGPDGEDDGWEVVEGIMTWQIACNWKLAAENFAGDTYHTTTHLSVDRLGIPYRTRLESETGLIAGKRRDVIRREPAGWRIARRLVLIDQGTLASGTLTTFF